jgi:hypothetical protein
MNTVEFRTATARVRAVLRSIAREWATLGLIASLVVASRDAAAAISIDRWTVDGGGAGFAQVGSLIYGSTLGQPDAGRIESAPYWISGGFWIPGSPIPLDADPSPTVPDVEPPSVSWIRDASPNPMLSRTRFEFALAEPGRVSVQVFDVTGALLSTIANEWLPAGLHAREWNGADASGRRLSPGVYLVMIRMPGLERSQKLVMLR